MEIDHNNIKGCRALVTAIFLQAFNDGIGKSTTSDRFSARRFIDKTNPLFVYYCDLLDLDPAYVEEKMLSRIRKHDLKQLKQFRE